MKWHQRLSKEELGVLSKERLLNLLSRSLDDDDEQLLMMISCVCSTPISNGFSLFVAAPDDDGYCICATTHLKQVVGFFSVAVS